MEQQPRLLVGKSLLANQRSLAFTAGFKVVEADFIQIESCDFSIADPNDYLLFTSQNAVIAVMQQEQAELLIPHPVYCVGRKTKALLERIGFQVVAWADNAVALAPQILAKGAAQTITFFSGDLHSDVLPAAFEAHGIAYDLRVCYANVARPVEVTANYQAALFFSPSAVRSFAQLNTFEPVPYFAIGPTTAAALEEYTELVIQAPQATIESVIATCAAYFKKQQTSFA